MKNRIADLRKEKGLTLKELGEMVGLKDNTISQYETGKREPKLETWLKLSNVLQVPLDYLQGISDMNNWDDNLSKKDKENLSKIYSQNYNDVVLKAAEYFKRDIITDKFDKQKLIFAAYISDFLNLIENSDSERSDISNMLTILIHALNFYIQGELSKEDLISAIDTFKDSINRLDRD